MEVGVKEAALERYPCAICADQFAEEEVVKHCEGKHIFCRGCFDGWVKSFFSNLDTDTSESEEHYNNPDDIHLTLIDDLLQRTSNCPVPCPVCRNSLGNKFTGFVSKTYPPCRISEGRIVECSYVNGIKHGIFKKTYLDGRVDMECMFVNGRLEGSFIHWFYPKSKDGTEVIKIKWFEASYVNGMETGISRQWHTNNKLSVESVYQDGILHGETKRWRENGTLYEISIYDRGNLSCKKKFYSNGNPMSETNYNPLRKGEKHGSHTEWHQNGTVKRTTSYIHGIDQSNKRCLKGLC